MKIKQPLTLHERQIRWFAVIFGTILVLGFALLLWMLNHQSFH